ncbi:MAG: class I SAM-dependent methyltransferase [Methylocystis sp.]
MACGCQFTQHDGDVYDVMHETGAVSYYSDYRSIAARCRSCFERKDPEGLRKLLVSSSKYKFALDRIARLPTDARILEIGCSRGYLAAHSILAGRNVLGVDVSREAVKEAGALFGDYFVLAGDPRIAAGAPYDLIYHVGMIGCVADPIGLTNDLLALLRPGGALMFNAPNRDALYLDGQLWLDSAPPPDLVTLFPPGFFTRRFSAKADVIEEIETTPAAQSMLIALRRALGVVWAKPVARPIEAAGDHGLTWRQPAPQMRRLFERIAGKIGCITGLDALAPPQPAEFGLFVTLTRK